MTDRQILSLITKVFPIEDSTTPFFTANQVVEIVKEFRKAEKDFDLDTALKIELKQTCSACPEQYDAFLNGVQVGYLRLRHGSFRVDYPGCGGETIYSASPLGDGIFDDDERSYYLLEAQKAIAKKLRELSLV